MPQRRLLFLDANRLSAFSWQSGRLHAEGQFVADTAGLGAFDRYLAEHASSVFSILADVVEEGLQIEDVPYVSGRDRSSLLQRRLAQYFYGTPFSLAMSLGRAKTARRDEKILFAALTQPRIFEPWLDAMRKAGGQLAGIYSTPLALASLLANRRDLRGPQLVLTISHSGVRQTFFDDGKLHFSRLTMQATGSFAEAAVACAVEARKIHKYLLAQRLVKRGTTLPVQILAHPAQFNAIRAHCQSTPDLDFAYLDLLEVAKHEKFKSPLADSYSELLLLHQLVHRPPSQQFAPPTERRFYRLWQIRSWLSAAAVIVFSACLLYAGKQYVDDHRMNERTQSLLADTTFDRNKYEAALNALPKVSVGTEDLRSLVNRFEELEKRSPMLEAIYLPLSRALDATPGINLDRIDWKVSSKVTDAVVPGSTAVKQAPIAIYGSYFAIADVSAQLPLAIANDHRAMLQLVNQLLAELGKDNTIRVQMTQMPFDIESGKTIKGSADSSTSQAEAPKLAFRIVRAVQ